MENNKMVEEFCDGFQEMLLTADDPSLRLEGRAMRLTDEIFYPLIAVRNTVLFFDDLEFKEKAVKFLSKIAAEMQDFASEYEEIIKP